MATTEFGNGSVPITKIEALAGELRLLKSGMADMQGRLDALLVEIGTELAQVRNESEPVAEVLPDRLEVEDVQDIAEIASEPATAETLPDPEAEVVAEVAVIAEIDAEPAIVAETELSSPSTDEPTPTDSIEEPVVAGDETVVVEVAEVAAQIETIEPVEIADTTAVLDIAVVEPITPVAEVAVAEVADAVPSEPIVETAAVAEEVSIVADAVVPAGEIEPALATAEVPVEAITVEAPVAEAPAAALPENVVVLAERRAQPRKGRTVIARTARWAAAIALIVMAVAVAATGTGFAGNGELRVIKSSVCAMAGEACSIVLGMP